jgi:hypothetical protein
MPMKPMDELEIQVAARLYGLTRDQHFELRERITNTVEDIAQRDRLLQETEPDVRARFRRIATRLMQRAGADIPHRPEVCPKHPDPAARQRRDREHAVPLALIHNRILNLPPPWSNEAPAPATVEEIAAILRHHIRVIGVTRGQHANVLPATMPPDWRWFDAPMARYQGHLEIDADGKCEHCRPGRLMGQNS